MKIVLVNPPDSERFPSSSKVPPLGLASIASFLNKYNVSIIDAAVIKEAINKILSLLPDIVGFTAMTPNYPEAVEMAKKLKKENHEIKLVIGGSHATFLPEDVLSVFDFVIRGEGEQTMLELCRKIGAGENDFENIDGLSWKKNGKIIHNKDREFIKNLDELPMPDYDLLDIENYQDKTPPSNIRKGRWVSYSSSRGCPFGCFYCSVTNFWGKIWRGHSAERIVNDIEMLIKKYSLQSIFFVDDNFTFRRERIMKMCRLIKERNLKFEWSCSCRVDQVDEELLREMKTAGCWRIGFGVEAGTQKVIDWYGKKITIERAVQAVKICRKVGISPFCFFLVGAPIETENDIMETISAAKKINPDIVGISFLTPFPGSKLYDYAIENNLLLTEDFREFAEDKPVMKGIIPNERLKELSSNAYKEFYFRPKYILGQFSYIAKNPKLALRGFKTILGWVKKFS